MAGPGLSRSSPTSAPATRTRPDVLKPSCLGCGPGSSLLVSDAEKKAAVDELLGN